MVWREWAGYFAAGVYADAHDIEYNADPRGGRRVRRLPPVQVRGLRPGRRRACVDRIIPRDATKTPQDQVVYTPWCDEDGKVMDDGTVARLGSQRVPVDGRRPVPSVVRAERARAGRADRGRHRAGRRRSRCRVRCRATCWRRDRRVDWSDVPYFGPARDEGSGTDARSTSTRGPGTRATSATSCGSTRRKAVELWDALLAAGEPYGIRPAGHPGAGRDPRGGRPDPDRGRLHQRRHALNDEQRVLAVRARAGPAS